MEVQIVIYAPEFGEAIEALQKRYIAANPKGAKFVPAEMYWKLTALEQGRNVFCAFVEGELAGYGALLPQPANPQAPPELANMIWVHIRFNPDSADAEAIQELLYERIEGKATVYARGWQGRATRIAIGCPEARSEEIAFFAGKSFQRYDALLQMCRVLSLPAPDLSIPEEISLRRWVMETEADKRKYIATAVAAFPQAPQTVAALDFYRGSWKGGMPIIAFDRRGEIIGGLMSFWYSKRHGVNEDIFVLPPWRRRGVARALIAEGIRFLVEYEIETAWLEVKESNVPAVHLYQSMSYEIANREEQWSKKI